MCMHIFTYAHFRMSLQFGAWILFLAYLNRRLLCRYYRLLYSFSAHQTGMTQSAVVGRSQDERGKTKGGSVAWKKTPKDKTECSFQPQPSLGEVWKGERIPMQITKWLPFINTHFILLKKRRRKWWDVFKSILAASLLICQKMSWGWMTDKVCPTVCIFKCESSACLFFIFISVFAPNSI